MKVDRRSGEGDRRHHDRRGGHAAAPFDRRNTQCPLCMSRSCKNLNCRRLEGSGG